MNNYRIFIKLAILLLLLAMLVHFYCSSENNNEMVLDFMALNKIELLPWDGNTLSEKGIRRLTNKEYILLDKASEIAIAGDELFKEMRVFFKSNKQLQK
jgi:hypothetical protein